MGLTHSNLRIWVPTQLPMGQNEINPTHLGTRGYCPGLRRMIRNQVVEKAG
jgi:hypothetical protein